MKMTKKVQKNADNMVKWSAALHFVMAANGGFFAIYAILSRMNNLGQAQTANLIEMICDILGRDMLDVVERAGAAVIFIAALILATVLEKRTDWELRYAAVIMDMLAALAVGFIPMSVKPVLALYPVFFATPFQWCVFKGVRGYGSSTIFCTNNLRQTTTALTEYFLLPKDDAKRGELLVKAGVFGGTLCSFYVGAVLGGTLWQTFEVCSIWFNIAILTVGLILVRMVRKREIAMPVAA